MKTKDEHTIKRTFDPANLPVLSDKQRAMLAKLAEKSETEIDYSDAPPSSPNAEWYRAALSPLYRPAKQVTTIRLDADILVWLKSSGKGYQTRINSILRQSMLQDLKQHTP